MKEILIGGMVAMLCFAGTQDVNAGRATIGSVGSRVTIGQQAPAKKPNQSQQQQPAQNQVQQPANNGAGQIVNGQLVPSNGQLVPSDGQLVPADGQISQVDARTWGSNALQLMEESSTISTYGTNLSKYLRYFGHFGKKLPVTNKKIATKMSKEIRPLIDFMKSLANTKTKASKVQSNWNKAQAKLSGLKYLSDEFEKVAIVQAAILLGDQGELDKLATDKQACAKAAGVALTQFVQDNKLIQ